MHLFISLVLIIGFCLLLFVGLLSVLQDLMEREFHAEPVMAAPHLLADQRYQVCNSPSAGAAMTADVEPAPLRLRGGQRG